MNRTALAVLAAGSLAACATTATHPGGDMPAGWDRLEWATNSWGRPVSGWAIGPDGQGDWFERVNESGRPGPVGAYRLVHHDLQLNPDQRARLSSLLTDIPDPAPVATECDNFRTDDYYGTLRVTRAATTREIAWNMGCRDASYHAFFDPLAEADALVAAAGKAAPVTRTESYDPNGRRIGQ